MKDVINTLRMMQHVRVPEESKALGEAIDALKKRTPKRPYAISDEYYVCPSSGCGHRVVSDVSKFCINCGQAIDWKEVK